MLTNDDAVSPGPNQREGGKKEVNWAGNTIIPNYCSKK